MQTQYFRGRGQLTLDEHGLFFLDVWIATVLEKNSGPITDLLNNRFYILFDAALSPSLLIVFNLFSLFHTTGRDDATV